MNGCESEVNLNEGYKLCIICCLPFVLNTQSENVEKISEFLEEIKNYDFDKNGNGEKRHICEEVLELEIRFGMSVCVACLIKINEVLTTKENMRLLESHVLSLQKEIIKRLWDLEKYTKKIKYHSDQLKKIVENSNELSLRKRLNSERDSIESNSMAINLRQWIVKDAEIERGKLQGCLSNSETYSDNAQQQIVNLEKIRTSNFDVVDLTLDSGDDETVKKPVDSIDVNSVDNSLKSSKKNADQYSEKILNCDLCCFSTSQESFFEQHMQHHENEVDTESKSLKCPHCPSKFATNQYFKFHIKCHRALDKMRCDICFKKIPLLSLANHLRSHFPSEKKDEPLIKIIYCPNCSFCCTSHQTYLLHLNCHKSEQIEGKFNCDICSEEFTMASYLLQHFHDKHEQPLEKWTCDFPHCNKVFISKSSLKDHKYSHSKKSNSYCLACNIQFKRANLFKSHQIIVHGASKMKCKMCEKEFFHEATLKTHIKEGHESKHVNCEICGKSYRNDRALRYHVASHGPNKFSCKQCGKGFKIETNFKNHLKIHSGVKNWKCVYCGKAFVRKTELRVHVRLHTGERPFVCEVCGKDFSRASILMSHKKKLHPT